jgi:hypothetical protein
MVNFNVRPTRGIAPPVGRAALELVQFPLYSAAALDAAAVPSQISFFNYALGQGVSTNLATAPQANRFHTNMETSNFLSAPKTFTVQQVRVIVAQASYASSTPNVQANTQTAAAAAATTTSSVLFNDTLALGSMAFRFFVGPKDYVNAPLWSIAANTGLGGTASVSVSSNCAVAAGTETGIRSNVVSTPYYGGKSWTVRTWPILLANQQSFGAELTNQFDKTNLSLGAVRLVFVVLEGILGREVS